MTKKEMLKLVEKNWLDVYGQWRRLKIQDDSKIEYKLYPYRKGMLDVVVDGYDVEIGFNDGKCVLCLFPLVDGKSLLGPNCIVTNTTDGVHFAKEVIELY